MNPAASRSSISRRQMLFGAAAAPFIARSASAATKQNILFIAVDDLNDWIGCLGGHPQARTPNLDRVASQGVLFTNAHCAAPLCNPSRAALMTGIRPSTSGVYDNNQPWRKSDVLKDAVTLSSHFRANGYRAIGSGKIYHGGFPDAQSWDDYFPNQTRNVPPQPKLAEPLPMNGIPRTAHFDWGPIANPDTEMSDYQVVDWVSKQLSEAQKQPLFLACGFTKPHLPWYIPKKYFDQFPLSSIKLPPYRKDDLGDVPAAGVKMAKPDGDHRKVVEFGQWEKAVQSYLAAISFMDGQLGRVMRALETGPNANNTAVVLWSDHGWHLGEKSHWRKFSLWEESTRSVLMMNIPGVTKPGGRCSRAVNLLDIYPTLCETHGLSKPAALEGTSFVAQLRNPSAPRPEPTLTTYLRGNHSLRDERWRYTRYADKSEELYDHGNDPQEYTNLAARPDMAKIKEKLAAWFPKTDAPPSPVGRGVEGEPF